MLRTRLVWICLPVVLLLLAATAAQASYMGTVLTNTPVGYWRLGETGSTTAVNSGSTGTAQNGTATSAVALGGASGALPNDTDKAGTFAGGANGASQVTIDGTPFNFGLGDPFSLEAWVKITDTTNTMQGIVCKYDNAGANDCGIVFSACSNWTSNLHGKFEPLLWLAGGNDGCGVAKWGDTTTNLGDGSWHYVAVTKAAGLVSSGINLYVDGSLTGVLQEGASPGISSTTDVTNTDPVTIGTTGASSGSPSANLVGSVDEVAIYSGVLSANDIAAHWAHRNDVTPEPSALVLLVTGLLGLLAYAWRRRK